ncbi:MAG: leucyl/phenylalanyl-tRNA--protein transferase [Gallionella sp.]|nr:leucyl/phenylalanyl-tRNA--protein transferase [Gallionella sp.]MDD4947065.1 leucyl/phenylalanyl-tRNA--protein transferase [Gallionella sp.]MDD5612063.1 leucyl/phenylalanyl-tRNA--protein transferase [Gallionella sp.]
MIPWLTDNTPFPPLDQALAEPNGLLAVSRSLSSTRLTEAYRNGIFPWFNPGEPVLWWSPAPRMVLFPDEFRITHSFDKVLRNADYQVRTDTAFELVMRACAAPRDGQRGSWIDERMIAAYCALHEAGLAHSVETWRDGELIGGLYGVSLGRMFYGESMFSRAANGSKIALAHLVRQLLRWQQRDALPGRLMVDCQMHTPHLASLGAREIPREEFVIRLKELVNLPPVTHWQFDPDLYR